MFGKIIRIQDTSNSKKFKTGLQFEGDDIKYVSFIEASEWMLYQDVEIEVFVREEMIDGKMYKVVSPTGVFEKLVTLSDNFTNKLYSKNKIELDSTIDFNDFTEDGETIRGARVYCQSAVVRTAKTGTSYWEFTILDKKHNSAVLRMFDAVGEIPKVVGKYIDVNMTFTKKYGFNSKEDILVSYEQPEYHNKESIKLAEAYILKVFNKNTERLNVIKELDLINNMKEYTEDGYQEKGFLIESAASTLSTVVGLNNSYDFNLKDALFATLLYFCQGAETQANQFDDPMFRAFGVYQRAQKQLGDNKLPNCYRLLFQENVRESFLERDLILEAVKLTKNTRELKGRLKDASKFE